MDAPVDPAIVDAIGGILSKGGNAATLLLAYFGLRICRAITAFLDKVMARVDQLYYIMDRLDRHFRADNSSPSRPPPLPDTIPINRKMHK